MDFLLPFLVVIVDTAGAIIAVVIAIAGPATPWLSSIVHVTLALASFFCALREGWSASRHLS